MRLQSSGVDKDQRRVLVKVEINLPLSQKEGNVLVTYTTIMCPIDRFLHSILTRMYGLKQSSGKYSLGLLFVMQVFLCSIERFQAPKGGEHKK